MPTMLEDGDYRRILGLGGEILSCRNTDDLMDMTVDRINRLIRSRSVAFFVTKSANWKWEAHRTFRLDGEFPRLMTTHFKEDPGRAALLQSWTQRRSNILNSDAVWPRTGEPKGRYYAELCKPRGIRHAMAITIAAGEDHFGALVLYRSPDEGHFDKRDEQMARLILPFLRSGLDRTCMLQKQQWAGWLLGLMAADLPYRQVIALGADLKPLAALPVSSGLLDDMLGDLQRPAGEPSALAPDLAAICRQLLADDAAQSAVLAMRARAAEGRDDPFRVEIDKHRAEGETLLILRVLTSSRDMCRFGAPDGPFLTEQQKRIVQYAASGASNVAIAANMGLASSTVSHHLSAALRKTGRSARWQLRISPDLAERAGSLPLSPRQKQVLEARLSGLSTAATARALGISEVTVRNHLRALYRSLGVRGFNGVLQLLAP